ncbi:MAG TPA: EVE domain-containing protein [bacterium]|nr:EVE domain-containing protein [bacterium]
MNYWLMKSEPESYSIDDLKRDKKTHWDGVRNYQVRNFMRDQMKVGDMVLFYHSSAEPPGVAGLAQIGKTGYPDPTAWDPKDHHYDPKSDPTNPTWLMVDVKFVEKFPHFVSLAELRANTKLKDLLVLKRGMRLSVQPVEKAHFEIIQKMGKKA